MYLIYPLIIVLLRFFAVFSDPFLRDIPEYAIPTATSPKAVLGIASTYGRPKDSNGGGSLLACAPDYRVQSMPEMNVCASRTYTCGTILAVEHVKTKKRTLCRVLDRGPYGACTHPDFKKGKKCPKGYWVVKIKASDPGVWRGDADLTPSVAAAIGLSGLQWVKTWVVYAPIKKMVVKSKAKKKKRPVRVRRPNV